MTSSSSTICHLPNEILSEVVSYLPVYHGQHVVDSSHVASFSSASRRMRAVSLSHLYREVSMTSLAQLSSFHRGSSEKNLTKYLRSLNIFMDEAFLDGWIAASKSSQPVDPNSPFASLAHLIVHARRLGALRLRVAEPSGPRSAWHRFGVARASGIKLGRSLRAVWPKTHWTPTLSELRILELDGFQDVQLLLRLAPNLRTLRMSMSAGFSRAVNDDLVEGLRYVPKLQHLSYTPDTLQLSASNTGDAPSSVAVLEAIAKILPSLQTLDLQTRYHRHAIYLCSSSAPLVEEELASALRRMPNIRSIRLPSSVITAKDFHTLRSQLPISPPESALEELPALREAMQARTAALKRASASERATVQSVAEESSHLREVVFSRNVDADDRMEYSVHYEIQRVPSSSSSSNRVGGVASRTNVVVSPAAMVHAAATPEVSATLLPQTPQMSLALTLQQLWAGPPAGRRIRTLVRAWSMAPIYAADVYRVHDRLHGQRVAEKFTQVMG